MSKLVIGRLKTFFGEILGSSHPVRPPSADDGRSAANSCRAHC